MNFENKKIRMNKINQLLKKYDIADMDESIEIVKQKGIDIENHVKNIQPIAFNDAVAAYTIASSIVIKNNIKSPKDIALLIGETLQSFTLPGSVSELRKIGVGHGQLASKLLDEHTKSFCFLAGHESFAAAEGAIGVANFANKVRKEPLRVILNGLGKDAAYIISRMRGFTYVKTDYDHEKNKLNILEKIKFGNSNSNIFVYGCEDVFEGVAVMKKENVDISITGNSTNPVRFTHPVAGIYKNYCNNKNKNYFSVASGGGTGRTMHPDNMGSGPASYGLTDTMGRMHADAQFAGSSSVPSHVEMMGFIGMGNNPIVGCNVSLSVLLSNLNND